MLGFTVEERQIKIVEFLLDRGVDVNSLDFALHIATAHQSQVIIDLLLARGADIDRVNNIGETPMLLAASYGYERILFHYIELGANPQIASCLGLKPIHHILAWQMSKVIDRLVTSELDRLDVGLFLESPASIVLDLTPVTRELSEIATEIFPRKSSSIKLVNFFSLSAAEQTAIVPQLYDAIRFCVRDGDIVTDGALDVLACVYEEILGDLLSLLRNESKYSHPVLAYISYAAREIRFAIYNACETATGDRYFEDDALESSRLSLIRYLSRIIRSCFAIEKPISTRELKTVLDRYLHP